MKRSAASPKFTRQLLWAFAFIGMGLFLRAAVVVADEAALHAEPAQNSQLRKGENDILSLSNGDMLYGNLMSIDLTNEVRWQHPDALEPIHFRAEAVSEITLSSSPPPNAGATKSCIVKLINGDEITGELIQCDSERVILETWFAGRMEVSRKKVQLLIPKLSNQPVLFTGPASLEGWTMGKVDPSVGEAGQWHYRDGALYARKAASIARDLQLPDVVSLQFDLSWKGVFSLAIALYTDYLQPVKLATKEQEPNFGGFYSLQLNPGSANLLRVKKQEPLKFFDQTPVPLLGISPNVHLEILVSKPKHSITLLVDGKVAREWVDTDFAGEGTGIRIVHQGMGAVKISNLIVKRWDGQLAEPPSNAAGAGADLLKLRNGDRLAGHIDRVENGKVNIRSEGNAWDVPIDRVKQMELAWNKSDLPPGPEGNVQGYLQGGGLLTFSLAHWDSKDVTGSSLYFGTMHLKPTAFARLQFKK